jgi:hypothetical protein
MTLDGSLGVNYPDATTQTTAGTQSLTSNGYVKLPNGLIIQWASLNITANPTTWTFPIAFTTACYSVNGTAQTTLQRFVTVSASTTTTATVYGWSDAGSGWTGTTYMIAIGK